MNALSRFIEKTNTRRWIAPARGYFVPDDDFSKTAKAFFLLRVSERTGLGAQQNATPRFLKIPLQVKYSFAGFAVLLFLGAGLMIYADSTNVSADHPLYNLKRADEKIQLAMTPKSQRPDLRNRLAIRRAEEIRKIKIDAINALNYRIKELEDEYNKNIDYAFLEMKEMGYSKEDFASFCGKVKSTISVYKKNGGVINEEAAQEFMENCTSTTEDVL